ncbi:hypothetical protein ACFQ5D_03785 [Paenibacillus farraposensis]|uniref:Uncharacterized protein n=1 Tax=Paenibacillus farraposensis TaxID=2807095 RepID=A0ABW4D9D3_9BACL|nr:hypothetical protein [Paenibacillus farraposensis]MCC3382165.1 hypothetical protein [Paenibacillus farraposensis]
MQKFFRTYGTFGCGSWPEDGLPRQQILQLIVRLEREASECEQLVQYKQTVLVRQQQEFEDAKLTAMKMVQDAEEQFGINKEDTG